MRDADMFDMQLYEVFLLPIMGLLVGIIAAMLGIGGGVFVVPALQLLPMSITFSPHMAAGTSLGMIVFKSLSSTMGYARQKRIDYKIGLFMVIVTIPGALLGATLTEVLSSEILIIIFSIFLLYVASRMIFSYSLGFIQSRREVTGGARELIDCDGRTFNYQADIKLGLPLGFFAGISSGLLGIGGGALMVPILHFAMSFPMHIAVATSVFIMIFTSTSAVATHVYFGNVQFGYVILLSIGVIIGAQIGTRIAKRTSSTNLKKIFGVLLIIVSLRMFLKLIA
jgi:uncharacterized membrane protein YfcA